MLTLAILVVIGYALYVMTPAERTRVIDAVLTRLRRAKDEAERLRAEPDAFGDTLRERTPLAVVTPALIALNALVFLFMLFGTGSFSNPETLVAWGGNFGPRTTNGEWSRLVTAMFIHAGMFHLLINIAGLAQVGLLVERLLGHLTLAVVYFAAGVLASLESLSANPIGVSVGASGAIFGVYGLLVAAVMWGLLQQRSTADALQLPSLREPLESSESLESGESAKIRIPLNTLKMLAPAAGIFLLYNLADGLETAELAGLVAGFASGLVLTRHAAEDKPPVWQVGAALAATILVVAVSAAFLSGVADVRPEMARVVALEDRTARTYDAAVKQFKNGGLSAEALAQVIDKKIVPELREAQARLKTLKGVPHEHKPMVDSAEEYLRLRDESWRIRADGLHKRNMPTLQKAERPERAALEALQRITPASQN